MNNFLRLHDHPARQWFVIAACLAILLVSGRVLQIGLRPALHEWAAPVVRGLIFIDKHTHKSAARQTIDEQTRFIEINAGTDNRAELWSAYTLRARAYAAEGRDDLAKADLKAALTLHQTPDIQAQTFLIRAYIDTCEHHFKDTMSDANAAVRDDPNNIQIYLGRALFESAFRQYHHALTDLAAVTARLPKWRADQRRILTEMRYLPPDMRRKMAARIDEIDNRFVGLVYSLRAMANDHIGLKDAAIADYTAAIHAQPEQSASYYHRGSLYLSQGKFASASADYWNGFSHEFSERHQRHDMMPKSCRNWF